MAPKAAAPAKLNSQKRPADPEPRPAPTYSTTFAASDADLVVISSDNVRFRVHRINLSTSSSLFADMFAVGSSETNTATLELEEDSETFEGILPFIYPNEIQRDDVKGISRSEDHYVRALENYDIVRGLEHVDRGLCTSLRRCQTTPNPSNGAVARRAYASASHFKSSELAALAAILLAIHTEVSVDGTFTLLDTRVLFPLSTTARDSLIRWIGKMREDIDELRNRALVEVTTTLTPGGFQPTGACAAHHPLGAPWSQVVKRWEADDILRINSGWRCSSGCCERWQSIMRTMAEGSRQHPAFESE